MADIPQFLPPNLQGLAIGAKVPDTDRTELGQEQFLSSWSLSFRTRTL